MCRIITLTKISANQPIRALFNILTTWKVSKYGVFSGPYFLYSVRIQENTDQKKLCIWSLFTHCLKKCFFFPINISVYIIHSIFLEVVTQRCSMKKGVLTNFTKFTGKHLRQSLFFNYNFIKKETLAKVFSCEFCETSKNTFFTEYLWVTSFFFRKLVVSDLFQILICNFIR